MSRRSGTTLIEVLVAIFVMGIGLIALLVLFPLGALRMQQAMQDSACSLAANNATSIATTQKVRSDPSVVKDYDLVTDVFVNPSKFDGSGNQPADPDGPSYPVLVDPLGVRFLGALPAKDWIAGDPKSYVRRRSVSFASTTAEVFRWFTLTDGINFDTNGLPKVIAPGSPPVIERDIRFNWAMLLQRPRSSDTSVVNCTIMVRNRGGLTVNTALTPGEYVYKNMAYFDPNRRTVTISYKNAGSPGYPPVRTGDWILDTTLDNSKSPLVPHGYFYRVVSVNDIDSANVELEVQTPLRGFANTKLPSTPAGYQGTVVIFEGVAEVFERGLGRSGN